MKYIYFIKYKYGNYQEHTRKRLVNLDFQLVDDDSLTSLRKYLYLNYCEEHTDFTSISYLGTTTEIVNDR